jgi:hypothetical protein
MGRRVHRGAGKLRCSSSSRLLMNGYPQQNLRRSVISLKAVRVDVRHRAHDGRIVCRDRLAIRDAALPQRSCWEGAKWRGDSQQRRRVVGFLDTERGWSSCPYFGQRSFSAPYVLRFGTRWITSDEDLWNIVKALDLTEHLRDSKERRTPVFSRLLTIDITAVNITKHSRN